MWTPRAGGAYFRVFLLPIGPFLLQAPTAPWCPKCVGSLSPVRDPTRTVPSRGWRMSLGLVEETLAGLMGPGHESWARRQNNHHAWQHVTLAVLREAGAFQTNGEKTRRGRVRSTRWSFFAGAKPGDALGPSLCGTRSIHSSARRGRVSIPAAPVKFEKIGTQSGDTPSETMPTCGTLVVWSLLFRWKALSVFGRGGITLKKYSPSTALVSEFEFKLRREGTPCGHGLCTLVVPPHFEVALSVKPRQVNLYSVRSIMILSVNGACTSQHRESWFTVKWVCLGLQTSWHEGLLQHVTRVSAEISTQRPMFSLPTPSTSCIISARKHVLWTDR